MLIEENRVIKLCEYLWPDKEMKKAAGPVMP